MSDWIKVNERESLMNIGQRLVNERKKRNMDQREFADRVGTTQTSIRRLEGGETNVSAVLLVRAAKTLDMNLVDLLAPIKSERMLVDETWRKHEGEIKRSTSAMGLTENDQEDFYTQRDLLRLMKLWPR
jgi:transcriptional regulator with XRE-family HTH domain